MRVGKNIKLQGTLYTPDLNTFVFRGNFFYANLNKYLAIIPSKSFMNDFLKLFGNILV